MRAIEQQVDRAGLGAICAKLPQETIFAKIRELVDLGGTEILIQGGLNPALKVDYFEALFRATKARFAVHIHGLSRV